MKRNVAWIVAAAACLVGPWAARAQFSADGIAGTGTAVVKKAPQVLRLQIDLIGKGKDLKLALEKIKARRDTAKAALLKMGATEGSIKFGELSIVPEKNDQQRRMEMMVRQRMQRPGRPTSREAEKASPVTVTINLKAEWAVQGESPEAWLLASDEIQKKVKAADLAGLKESQQLSAEEQEAAEETEGSDGPQMYDGSEQGPKKGEPLYLYVSKISPEERTKALNEAFTKARTEAEDLAKAAGVTLGSLRSVASAHMPGTEFDETSGYGGYYQQMMYRAMRQSGRGEGDANDEAVGVQPGPVSLKITVNLTYALK